jgi:hypothetical protein
MTEKGREGRLWEQDCPNYRFQATIYQFATHRVLRDMRLTSVLFYRLGPRRATCRVPRLADGAIAAWSHVRFGQR